MSIYYRDVVSGMSPFAYFLAKCIYDLVHLARMSLIFNAIFFMLSSPRGGYGYWYALVAVLFWAMMGVCYFISIVVPFNRATTIAVVVAVTFSVTSGLTPSLSIVDNWGPLQLFWYTSFNRWAAEGFTILNYSGQPTAGRMEHAIAAAGYNSNNISLDIGIVFLLGLAWRVAAFIALKRSKPRAEF